MRTEKGRGVPAVEDQTGKHGKTLDDSEAAISELSSAR
jgi:transketolase